MLSRGAAIDTTLLSIIETDYLAARVEICIPDGAMLDISRLMVYGSPKANMLHNFFACAEMEIQSRCV